MKSSMSYLMKKTSTVLRLEEFFEDDECFEDEDYEIAKHYETEDDSWSRFASEGESDGEPVSVSDEMPSSEENFSPYFVSAYWGMDMVLYEDHKKACDPNWEPRKRRKNKDRRLFRRKKLLIIGKTLDQV